MNASSIIISLIQILINNNNKDTLLLSIYINPRCLAKRFSNDKRIKMR